MLQRLLLLRDRHGWSSKVLAFESEDRIDKLRAVLAGIGIPSSVGDSGTTYSLYGIEIEVRSLSAYSPWSPSADKSLMPVLREQLARADDTVLTCNLRDLPMLVALHQLQRKAAVFLTEDGYPRRAELTAAGRPAAIAAAIAGAEPLFVASRFLQRSFAESWSRTPWLLTNAIAPELYNCSAKTPRDCIGMLQPYTHKGVDILLGVARAMPERRFITASGAGEDYRSRKPEILSCSNIELSPFQIDPCAIYSRCRIVLVPSLWEEPYSRIAVEAQLCGALVIASDVGGTRDAGGDGADYIPVKSMPPGSHPLAVELGPWIDAIKRHDDHRYLEEKERRRAARVEQFTRDLAVDMRILHDVLSALGSHARASR